MCDPRGVWDSREGQSDDVRCDGLDHMVASEPIGCTCLSRVFDASALWVTSFSITNLVLESKRSLLGKVRFAKCRNSEIFHFSYPVPTL